MKFSYPFLTQGYAKALNIPLRTLVFFRPLIHLLVYRAARARPDAQVSIFGLVSVKNLYFPFVMLSTLAIILNEHQLTFNFAALASLFNRKFVSINMVVSIQLWTLSAAAHQL